MTQAERPEVRQRASEEPRASGRRDGTVRRSRSSHSHLPVFLAGVVAAVGVGAVGLAAYELGRNDQDGHVANATSTPSLEPTVVIPSASGDLVVSFPPASPSEAPTAMPTASPTEAPATPAGNPEYVAGENIVPGIELPAVISPDMVRAFVPDVTIDGNAIAQYQEGQWFLPVYNAAHAGEQDNYVGIGPWAPIAVQSLEGKVHLKTEGDPGLFDVVVDEPGTAVLWFSQLGAHQHETAVNGNGESNPEWRNQYTLHLTPGQQVLVVDRFGNQVLWDDNQTPMVLAASEAGDFSIEVPQTAENVDTIFGLVINFGASPTGVQELSVKVQRGPNDMPGLTGENEFFSTGKAAIQVPAIPESY